MYSRALVLCAHLMSGVSVRSPSSYGCTALTWAARNGSSDVLKYLLAREGDVESVSYGGFKPVHHACNLAKEATLREVIAAGCNVSSTDEAGNTALHWAAARYGPLSPSPV